MNTVVLNNRLASYSDCVNKFPVFPKKAVLLGVESDGYPVLLDMYSNPEAGSKAYAVIGDINETREMLFSACRFVSDFSPLKTIVVVITNNISAWRDFRYFRNIDLEGVYSANNTSADDVVSMISEYNETCGDLDVEKILLIIDDVESILKMDFLTKTQFRDIISNPSASVTVIATASKFNESALLGFGGQGAWATIFETHGECDAFAESKIHFKILDHRK